MKFVSRKNADKPIITVPQLHPLGCAVACVASRCGVSYSEAYALFDHPEHAWTRGYYCSEVVKALLSGGRDYSFSKYKPSHHEKKLSVVGTIAFVEPCSTYPAGHFFLKAPKGWMNPWSNFPSMNNIEAEFQSILPGKVSYIIFEE